MITALDADAKGRKNDTIEIYHSPVFAPHATDPMYSHDEAAALKNNVSLHS